jgi:4-hydroxythreonine-4-phosphate dehydrogenase
MGDPASIGPEISVKAMTHSEVHRACQPFIIGDSGVIKRALIACKLSTSIHTVSDPKQCGYQKDVIDLLDLANVDASSIEWGKVQGLAGKAASEYVLRAIDLAKTKKVDAIATGPISKEALKAGSVPYIDHTEILAKATGASDPLTMFETLSLRIFFLTRHVSLADAIKMIKRPRIVDYLYRSADALHKLGFKEPRIAVAGLNPHAGEHGLFGNEDEEEIRPAVDEARSQGLLAFGPFPPDSIFHFAAKGNYDAVLSLFHDQGHIAAKMLDFERTVSITCGLPFLRTSVDHGTAFDIAGKGIANETSMVEAILAAARYAPRFN